MGYQLFIGSFLGPRPDAALSRRLPGGTASPRRAWTARHEFDSRMGYQPFFGTGAGPRPDAPLSRRLIFRHGFAAARLHGATRVRFSYGLPTFLRHRCWAAS